MKKISCIICAYNEEKRIGKVLDVVSQHPLIDEIIMEEDGSTDNTVAVVRRYKNVKLFTAPKNRGKTKSLADGLKRVRNDTVLLLDADLKHLTKQDITDLLDPVLKNRADMSISLRRNTLLIYKIIGIDFVSGERVFNKALLKGQENTLQKLPRFGFEVFLNNLFLRSKGHLAIVHWKKVTHARKSEKMGWFKGQWAEIKMGLDIVKTIGLKKIISQNRALLKRARGV